MTRTAVLLSCPSNSLPWRWSHLAHELENIIYMLTIPKFYLQARTLFLIPDCIWSFLLSNFTWMSNRHLKLCELIFNSNLSHLLGSLSHKNFVIILDFSLPHSIQLSLLSFKIHPESEPSTATPGLSHSHLFLVYYNSLQTGFSASICAPLSLFST